MIIERNQEHFKHLIKTGDLEAVIKFIWAVFDDDDSGYLDMKESKNFVRTVLSDIMEIEYSEERFLKLFKEVDSDNSGTIEKDEMRVCLKKMFGDD